MNRILSRLLVLMTAAVLGVAALGVGAPAWAAPSSSCSTPWGSVARSGGGEPLTPATLTGVRAGRHACFDRLVLDLGNVSAFDSWSVRYASSVRDVSGERAIPLRGGAYLAVDVWAHGQTFPRPSREIVTVSGFPTLRQVAWGGSFEGETVLGVGVRARLPFRAFVLGEGPGARLVLDVAHRW
ncbi:AMIN-like domain-containing (lipo)protein [Geodermatophilus ruber]|uniref:AMIN-like domain-containing protein n=1 Tax=Geodermatophilus ruber TaxID=504800 RepID=A0A1I4FW93_9ACTN|nr:hypothetical protein [Geodermatophilus ruber]SFL22162.1 hypothetical protein SAMN04488085_10832 [Geodermatophilus ruber]